MVEVGGTAPDFTLTGTRGEEVREFTLSEFADGRPVVLCFYQLLQIQFLYSVQKRK